MTDNLPQAPTDEGDPQAAVSVVARNSVQIGELYRVIQFRGRPMVMTQTPYPHFVPLHKDRFDRLAYPILGGVSRSRMSDVFAYLGHTAEDLSDNDHKIGFGVAIGDMEAQADTDLVFMNEHKPAVWNTRDLTWEHGESVETCVWRSPHPVIKSKTQKRVDFVMQLAGGKTDLYDDIMQSIAPIIMDKKPDGVIWWVGDGANGKSTLMDAIYKIFPGQLSSITVKRLTDGRDAPSLNGTLANVVKESSEGRIEDTEVYKSIGTHENFRVHKFHSQDDMEIKGNLHHIFNANLIPAFNDKGFSARRRTFIVPFNERFKSDPTFEERTFTPQMFGELVAEMTRYAQAIKKQGYRYKFSAATLAAKETYDTEANNAEEYAREIIRQGVVAFDSFTPLRFDYENWCGENGYVALGLGNLKRAMTALGFDRASARTDSGVNKVYKLPDINAGELTQMGLGRSGLYTTPGFEQAPVEIEPEKLVIPEFESDREEAKSPW